MATITAGSPSVARRLRAIAEGESGTQGFELFEGDAATPEAVADALNAMTFAIGRRFIVVDGVERWKDSSSSRSTAALQRSRPTRPSPSSRARTAAPRRRSGCTRPSSKAGGDISAEESVKPWELPKWVIARRQGARPRTRARRGSRAHRPRRRPPAAAAPRAREARAVPRRRARASTATTVDELTAPSAERKAWSLADALLGGDPAAATRRCI